MTEPLERRPMTNRAPKRNLKHGAYVKPTPANRSLTAASHEAYGARVRAVSRLSGEMFKAMPWLSEADRPAVRSWAELEIITSNAFTNLMRDGIIRADGTGEPRQLTTVYRQLKQTQLMYEKELLMTPASRALCLGKGGSDAPIDLVAHFAKTVVSDEDGADDEK